jgi:hypothetical protein
MAEYLKYIWQFKTSMVVCVDFSAWREKDTFVTVKAFHAIIQPDRKDFMSIKVTQIVDTKSMKTIKYCLFNIFVFTIMKQLKWT